MSTRAKQIATNWITENEQLVVNVHDKIWRLAEVGLQEYQTAKLLTDLLSRSQFKLEIGVAGMPTAFVASYGSGKPIIGIMGELDALPGISQKPVPKKEPLIEGAPGHGCGHQGYATAAVAGALAAKEAIEAENICGTIKCFGCPAEETLTGKVFMVRDGIFDEVDVCLGHHPGQVNGVNLRSGNAMNSVKFEFFGVPSHAAGSPEQGRSALDAAELMNIGVNYLREHVVQETRIHYVIEDGGHEPNVVPDYTRTWYYIRAPTRDMVDHVYDRVLKIADGADLMARTTHKVKFLTGVHNGIPNRTLADLIVGNMREIGAPAYTEEELEFAREVAKSIQREEKMYALRRSALPNWMKFMDIDLSAEICDPYGEEVKGGGGSSDVAEVAWNMPTQEFSTTMFIMGAPGHSWQNVASGGTSIGHKSSIFASKVMATTVIDLLMKSEVVNKAKEEWKQRMEGVVYKSPLSKDLKPPLDQLPSKRA
jgi:aminobenzoyl-glutamate utilization protein B